MVYLDEGSVMKRIYQDRWHLLLSLSVLAVLACFGLGTRYLKAGNQQNKKQAQSPKARIGGKTVSATVEGKTSHPANAVAIVPRNLSESQKLLKKSIELLRTTSIRSGLRQQGILFDTELKTTGTYLQADGGKGGTRISLEIKSKNLHLDIQMVNDGVYFFRKIVTKNVANMLPRVDSTSGETVEPTVERINLRLIRDRYAHDKSWPGHWIAFGGLYLFMDQARKAFDFEKPGTGKIKGIQYSLLKGVWKPEKLALLVPDQKASILNRKALDWKRIPRQIPLEIEIYFVESGRLAGFPYRVVFYRPTDDLLEGIKRLPVLATEYSDPEIVDTPSQSEFQFNADENEVRDVTDDFINSINN